MFERVELFMIGMAVVFDTALLLIVRERANRSKVAAWLLILVLGGWAFHVGTFGRILLADTNAPMVQQLDQAFMLLIVVGLLLMPCGMLHSAFRMARTGLVANPTRDARYLWFYTPLLLLPFAMALIARSDNRNLMDTISVLMLPYLAWLLIANVTAISFFWKLKHQYPNIGPFFVRLIVMLLVITVLAIAYGFTSSIEGWERSLRLPICLSPLVLAGLFVWYALRQRILPLVMDRTLMYGSLLVLGLLLHRITITPLSIWVRERSNIDLIIVEAVTVLGVILLIPSLRSRASEALRCLFSTNVFKVRDATRALSVSLSQQSQQEIAALLPWFANAMATQLDLDHVTIVIQKNNDAESAIEVFKSTEFIPNGHRRGDENDLTTICHHVQTLERVERGRIDARVSATTEVNNAMRRLDQALENSETLVAFRSSFRSVIGCVLLGDRRRNDRFADEQLVAISLLCDQLAATLENKKESNRRIQAERIATQNEKLSVLGLIAGSLAHELRNPLSSIRTIASLTMEELGVEHANRNDLSLIVSEVDRLTQTTQRLLDSARPADATRAHAEPDVALSRLLTILHPLAKKLHVALDVKLQCDGIQVPSTEVSLHEIFFNLIKNGIEAAAGQPNACVEIRSQRENTKNEWSISIRDNGAGVPEHLQTTMFEPFVTGKTEGTGLGLFVVAERIRELKGSIRYVDNREQLGQAYSGTTFHVSLPIVGN